MAAAINVQTGAAARATALLQAAKATRCVEEPLQLAYIQTHPVETINNVQPIKSIYIKTLNILPSLHSRTHLATTCSID